MSSNRYRVTAIALATIAATVCGAVVAQVSRPLSSPVRQTWPPAVVPAPAESPVLTAEESLKTLYLPPGYRAELIASDPLVQDPLAMDWDADGRLWLVEMPTWVANLQLPEPNLAPANRVVVLEDTNGDAVMDKRTVFADELVGARSIQVTEHGILVAMPPNVWLMRDTNGDLKVDTKESLTDLYGRLQGDIQTNASGLKWQLDNKIMTTQSDIYFEYRAGKFEVRRTLNRGHWGTSTDDVGRTYRNHNSTVLHVDLVQTPYYARNPALLRTRGSYESLDGPEDVNNLIWPVRETPGTNRAYQAGILRPDKTIERFTAAHSPTVYRGDRLPDEVYGNVFVAEPSANLISRLILEDGPRELTARKAYEKGEFVASSEERFRPVYLSNAPDGTLYIVDIYRGIIEKKAAITEYLHSQILLRNLEVPIHLGRIYRIVHESKQPDTTKPALSKASTQQLIGYLSHPNGWWADTARRVLVERGDKAGTPALAKLAVNQSVLPRVRTQALWTLDGYDGIEPATVIAALSDPSRDVRTNALRVAERFLADPASPVQAAVLRRLTDADWQVRQQLAASLGALPEGPREISIATLLATAGDDPVVVDAALSGLRGTEPAVLDRLLQTASATSSAREAAITMVAATIVRGGQAAAVQRLLAWASDSRNTPWARSAVLRGAEVALLGAPMPPVQQAGRGGRGGFADDDSPNVACPTCPGARGGPGGAYAFQNTNRGGGGAGAGAAGAGRAGAGRAGAVLAGRGGRGGAGGGGAALRLDREPTPLSTLAAAGGEFGGRAGSLLARIEWPGKPGMATPITPLTPAEQARFDAGREVYRNVCQACHQADGRGQDKLGANLIGSALALGPADIPARILINGKDGPIGLMPPIGNTLDDEQVANVLTYVRREWGQTGAAVTPDAVKAVRAQTAGRPRPWTNEELNALLAATPAAR